MIEEKGIDEQEKFLEFKQWDIANKTARVYRCGKKVCEDGFYFEDIYDDQMNLLYGFSLYPGNDGNIKQIVSNNNLTGEVSIREFDEEGNVETESWIDDNYNECMHYAYRYNSKGKLYSYALMKSNNFVWCYLYRYNEQGYLREKLMFDDKVKLDWIWRYKYNEVGQEIVRELYDSDEFLAERWEFAYSNGKKVSQTRYCPDYKEGK